MALEAGTRLGAYVIKSLLGTGGMGEVYRARDTRLNRDVALKILPPDRASDPDLRGRFEREAQAVAALNHPHIVTIHSVEEVDGTHFITMELVEGERLSSLIPRDGMTLERFFEIAIPLAGAMTAAHAKGITHRDLKPANVMVGHDDQLKVLDFGLAKLLENPEPGEGSTVAVQSGTQEGRILGTVAYMSPEQAEGKPVDPRSDVFSLGVIFYEMVTGERPFKGDTTISTITSILRDDPPSVTALRRALPRHLNRIVKRCLAKNADRRYQSAHDLRNDLLELKEEIDSGELVGGEAPVAVRTRPGGTRWALGVAAVGVAVVAGAYLLRRAGREETTFSPGASGQAMEMIRLTTTGKSRDAAVSGDGRYVAHVVAGDGTFGLWITQVSTSRSVELVPASEAPIWDPAFSPEGDFLYYCRREKDATRAALFRVPVLGGAPARVLDGVNSTVSFSPDGRRFAFGRYDFKGYATSLLTAGIDGGGERIVATKDTTDASEWFCEGPVWSPDGKILVAPVRSFITDKARIVEVPVDGGEERMVTPHQWTFLGEFGWLPDGSGLVFTANENEMFSQLWEVAYPSGALRRLTNDINDYYGIGLTADGNTLVTTVSERTYNLWIISLEGSLSSRQLTTGTKGGNYIGSWTKDGMLFYESVASGTLQIWSMGEDGSNPVRLTSGDWNANPQILPDGGRIVFESGEGGGCHIWSMDRDGSNRTQLTRGATEVAPRISPDGRWIVYEGGRGNLYKIPMEGGDPVRLTAVVARDPLISPDGKHVLYTAEDLEGGKDQIFLMPFEGGEPKAVLDKPYSDHEWAPDSKGIAYVDDQGGVGNIWIQPLDGSPPRQLTKFTEEAIADFAWSPDGKRMALSRGRTSSDIVLLKNFR